MRCSSPRGDAIGLPPARDGTEFGVGQRGEDKGMTTRQQWRLRAACLLWLGIIAGLALLPAAASAKTLRVVATHAMFGALARELGENAVEVHVIVPPQRDIHFLEPRPSDVLKLARAQLFIHSGLDLELWRGPLVEAARNRLVFPGAAGDFDAAVGVPLLDPPSRDASRAEGDVHIFGNPHYWLDPENLRIVARRLAEKLATLLPERAAQITATAQRFDAALRERIGAWRARFAPYAGQEIVAYHNSWPYLAQFLGVRITLFLEPKPGIPPSGKHLATIVGLMRSRNLRVIINEPPYPTQPAEVVAQRVGGRVVLLAQVPGALPQTDTPVSFFEVLVGRLATALGQGRG